MWLLHIFFGTFVLAQYYHPWVAPALNNYSPTLFWPEPFMPERPEWMWPQSTQIWPNHYFPLKPMAAGPADYESRLPIEARLPIGALPDRSDRTTPGPTPVKEVTPERFGFIIQSTNAQPILKGSSTLTKRQFASTSDSGLSARPTRTDHTFQTTNSVPISELSSVTTTETRALPPTTQNPVQAKIQLSVCINSCVTDKSIKSVCGSDNKTYQNRQFLDCAQQCGQSKCSFYENVYRI